MKIWQGLLLGLGVALLVVLCLLNPDLVLWVAGGALLPALWGVRRWGRARTRRLRLVVFACAMLVVVALATPVFLMRGGDDGRLPNTGRFKAAVPFRVRIEHASGPTRWTVTERVLVGDEVIEEATEDLRISQEEVLMQLRAEAEGLGWREDPQSVQAEVVLVRNYERELDEPLFPLQQWHEFRLTPLSGDQFLLGPVEADVVIDAPRYGLVATSPGPEETSGGRRDTWTLDIDDPDDLEGESPLEVSLASRPLRNAPLHFLADVSLGGAVKYVAGILAFAVVAVLKDRVTEWLKSLGRKPAPAP